jgi:hypothetical protein
LETKEDDMYTWDDSLAEWKRPGAYVWDPAQKAAREANARASAARGGRTYQEKRAPLELADPRKTIRSESATPIVIAVDVTGSMQTWPAEIFDRLPLLYHTLSQYRPEIEVSFAAIGDATCDRWPLQVTDFAKGFALEDRLAALYGEGGGGGGARESYELLAWFLDERCRTPNAERPILIIYGDEGFYPHVDPALVRRFLEAPIQEKVPSRELWRRIARRWNVFHLRKSYGRGAKDAEIREQWADAIGRERIVAIEDEQRAVDVALGLIARSWGRFDDFRQNMRARQDDRCVDALANSVLAIDPAVAGSPRPFDIPDTRPSPAA